MTIPSFPWAESLVAASRLDRQYLSAHQKLVIRLENGVLLAVDLDPRCVDAVRIVEGLDYRLHLSW
jgi:hypothetical protein